MPMATKKAAAVMPRYRPIKPRKVRLEAAPSCKASTARPTKLGVHKLAPM
jgi:hypothetical protein